MEFPNERRPSQNISASRLSYLNDTEDEFNQLMAEAEETLQVKPTYTPPSEAYVVEIGRNIFNKIDDTK